MNIAIVDNTSSDCQRLVNFLDLYKQKNQLEMDVTIFQSGEEFLNVFAPGEFNLVFLDIYMDGVSGMDAAYKIREAGGDCLIVFSTTSSDHAVESFRIRAFDYLLKPYDYDLFEQTMQFCHKALLGKERYIEVKEGRTYVKILLKNIIYTDYYNHYIQIHTKKRTIKCYMRFSDFAELLAPYPQFLSCYRNCIVNMDAIISLDEKDFIVSTGAHIPMTRSAKQQLRQHYADYLFDKLNGGLI